MKDRQHISLEEILVMLQTAKKFKMYEYYDGYYITIDGKEYLIYADEDITDAFYDLSLKVLPFSS